MFTGGSAPALTVPARSCRTDPGYWFPSSPVSEMLHGVSRAMIVRAAPEAGRATERPPWALAEHLRTPRTSVRLPARTTSRIERFEVAESPL
jgi:hypothetical protein